MKKSIMLVVLFLASITSFAQLRGSAITVTKTFDYTNFDKINFDNLDGQLVVEVGKPFGISVTIDDNLFSLLVINQIASQLTIALNGNSNNKLYIENTKIKVVVTMPSLTAVCNNGNSDLIVTNINSTNFQIENRQNGSTTLTGIVAFLEVVCKGNGILNAKNLVAKTANIRASGNGNVTINVTDSVVAKTSGNCTVVNIGNAKFNSNSISTGNSRFVTN